jgi:hypothetical protein
LSLLTVTRGALAHYIDDGKVVDVSTLVSLDETLAMVEEILSRDLNEDVQPAVG